MGAKNNTTPIGDGSVGLDSSIQSTAGKAIQEVVSENNLKAQLKTNASMKNFMGAVLRMVARWEPGDKMRILQTYGSVETLKSHPTGSQLDEAVATVLVSHLPKEEIRKIIGDEMNKEKAITKDVAAINAKSAQLRKRNSQLSRNNLGQQFTEHGQKGGNFGKTAANDKQLLKGIKKGGGVRPKPADHAEFVKIRKELTEVLESITDKELSIICAKLKISAEDMGGKMSHATMIKEICNMVNMYIILLLERDAKGVSPARFDPEVINQVEELLLLTTGGWMTGKVGINDLGLREKRKAAMAAKKALKDNKEAQKIKENAKKAINVKTYKHGRKKGQVKSVGQKTNLFEKVLGIGKKKREKTDANSAKVREKLDRLSDDQIRDLAASQGLEDVETKTIENLKDELALMGGSEMQQINEKTKADLAKAAKIKDPVKRQQEIEKIKASAKTAQKNSIMGAALEGDQGQQEFSDKIPIVTFNQSGELVSTGLLKAVPVFIAGSASKLGKLMTREEADNLKKKDNNELVDEFRENLKQSVGEDAGKGHGRKKKKANKLLNEIDLDDTFKAKTAQVPTGGQMIVGGGAGGGGQGGPVFASEEIANAYNAANTEKWKAIKDTNQKKKNELLTNIQKDNAQEDHVRDVYATGLSKKVDQAVANGMDAHSIPMAMFIKEGKGLISKKAKKIFKSATVDITADAKVQPVYLVNNGPLDDPTYNILRQTSSSVQAIASDVEQLPTLFMGLQQGGTAFNAESAAAGISMALKIANQAATAAAQFATGGSMRGGNRVSQIITGDHPQGRNNTELVSVDWANRNINVKPIPMMATGGDVKSNEASNITNVKRMTSSERGKPMVVSIGNGIVRYTKDLTDVTDDGSSTAVKVYSVNSGINEKIKVGDTEMSLFDAVYGVYASIGVLVNEVSTSNQLLAAISTSTTATARSTNKIAAASNNGGGSPFSFTTEIDDVLAGR